MYYCEAVLICYWGLAFVFVCVCVFHIYPYVRVCQFMWQFKCLFPHVCMSVDGGGEGPGQWLAVVWQAVLSPQLWSHQYQQTRLALSRECKSMSSNTQLFTHQAANTPHRHASLLMNNTHTTRRPVLHASVCVFLMMFCYILMGNMRQGTFLVVYVRYIVVLSLRYCDIFSRRIDWKVGLRSVVPNMGHQDPLENQKIYISATQIWWMFRCFSWIFHHIHDIFHSFDIPGSD